MIKILLPVDGSRHALVATRQLVRHTAWFKQPVEVELVTVTGTAPRVSGISRAVLKQADVDRHFRDLGGKALEPSRRVLDKAGLKHRDHVLSGEVAATLVKLAADTQCQMIYMGSRGLTALTGLALGSVATRVLHLARIPVVLVK